MKRNQLHKLLVPVLCVGLAVQPMAVPVLADSAVTASSTDAGTSTTYEEAKAAYDATVTAKTNADTAVTNAQAAVDAAQKAYDEATASSSYTFFQWLGNQGDLGATEAANYLLTSDGAEYTHIGTDGDATTITNLKKALDFLDQCNQIRESEGLSDLLVASSLMGAAERYANWSAIDMRHHGTFENLAWSTDPYKQWYTDEKLNYEKGSGQTGHYLNIINNSVEVTGYGFTTSNNTSAQEFGYKSDVAPSYTVSEYENKLNEYLASVEANAADEKAALTNAQNALADAKTKQTEAADALTKAKAALNAASVTPTPTSTPVPTATPKPTATPTTAPTSTPKPTATPTTKPTSTPKPTATPTTAPTATPTTKPTATPTTKPTSTPKPTATPTMKPTTAPTATPTTKPTSTPTSTPKPTATPTTKPTTAPTATPTTAPTVTPATKPTTAPTATPTTKPTSTPAPTTKPTTAPTSTPKPTATPTTKPTTAPTATPTSTPEPTTAPEPTTTPAVPTLEPWQYTVADVSNEHDVFVPNLFKVTIPNVKHVYFAVWSARNGQDDIVWKQAQDESDYYVEHFGYEAYFTVSKDFTPSDGVLDGTYNAHCYAELQDGTMEFIAGTTFEVSGHDRTLAVKPKTENTDYEASLTGAKMKDATKVYFAVWSAVNGQDDMHWLKADETDTGYSADIKIADFNGSGDYNVHCYAQMADGSMKFLGSTTFTVEGKKALSMYRLYNPNSGEHFYTSNQSERNHLVSVGWNYEGVGWDAPLTGKPIYRLYNKNAGDHHYTGSEEERDGLVAKGWKYEGIAWYTAPSASGKPQYRLYNPNCTGAGAHHYTGSTKERDDLVVFGWKYEGIAWYGM